MGGEGEGITVRSRWCGGGVAGAAQGQRGRQGRLRCCMRSRKVVQCMVQRRKVIQRCQLGLGKGRTTINTRQAAGKVAEGSRTNATIHPTKSNQPTRTNQTEPQGCWWGYNNEQKNRKGYAEGWQVRLQRCCQAKKVGKGRLKATRVNHAVVRLASSKVASWGKAGVGKVGRLWASWLLVCGVGAAGKATQGVQEGHRGLVRPGPRRCQLPPAVSERVMLRWKAEGRQKAKVGWARRGKQEGIWHKGRLWWGHRRLQAPRAKEHKGLFCLL